MRTLVVRAAGSSDHGIADALGAGGFDAVACEGIDEALGIFASGRIRVTVLVAASATQAAAWLRAIRSAPGGARVPVLVCATEWTKDLLAAAREERFGIVLVGDPEELRGEVVDVVGHLAARPEPHDERPNLLVMDDNVAVQALTRSVFDRAGFDVHVVGRVREATALLEQGITFDAALLDLNLPDGSGFDVLRAIREHGDVPVFIVSAMGQAHLVARAFDLGATDFIEKPFDPRELHARVARHL